MEIVGNLSLVGDWISKNEIDLLKSDPSIDMKDFDLFSEIYSTKFDAFLIMNLLIQFESLPSDQQPNQHISNPLLLTYQSSSSPSTRRSLNFLPCNLLSTSYGTLFSVIIQVDQLFQNLTILIIGPKAGYRVIEQYKLISNGMELLSHINITHRQKGSITIKKQYSRQKYSPNSLLNSSIIPIENESVLVCHWKSTKTHSSHTLRSITVTVGQPEDHHDPNDSHALYYPVCIILPPDRQWIVYYRYSQIRQLKKYLREEIDQLISLGRLPSNVTLPHFPPREVGNLSNRAIEERRSALEIFLDGVAQSGGYDCQDIVDVLAAFFEIPSHFFGPASRSSSPASNLANLEPTMPVSIFSSSISHIVTIPSTRLVESPMFENVSVFHWVTQVEYEIRIMRNDLECQVCSIYKRHKDITKWLNEVRSILEVTHPIEELEQLHLPSPQLLPTINTPSSYSKVDLQGDYVKSRSEELQRMIQYLISSYPDVLSLPITRSFLQISTSKLSSMTDSIQK